MQYIDRAITPKILEAHKYFPVILITGARQAGKSTLCKHLFPDYKFVNLEDITLRVKAMSDPIGFLNSIGDNVIIDEVQNVPELFSQIQVRVDERKELRYILTGSCNFSLMKKACQSMVGRVAVFTLPTLTLSELGADRVAIPTNDLLKKGSYPGVWNGMPIDLFYSNYYTTYIERDVRDLLRIGNLLAFDKFMRLMAGRSGSEYKASNLAVETGVSANTINEWVSVLMASYIVFPLRPYFANISKRLTKMPKYYFYDTGLLCFLLGIETPEQLSRHPLRGAVFENLAVSELYRRRMNEAKQDNLYFYREHSGREVDVISENPDGLKLYEIKSASTFRSEFMVNIDYLKGLLPDVAGATVIYDGESFVPDILNIRAL